jgi:hypothetical protein
MVIQVKEEGQDQYNMVTCVEEKQEEEKDRTWVEVQTDMKGKQEEEEEDHVVD